MTKLRVGSTAEAEKWLVIKGYAGQLYNLTSGNDDGEHRKLAKERIERLYELVTA